jgi:hypothetical protein
MKFRMKEHPNTVISVTIADELQHTSNERIQNAGESTSRICSLISAPPTASTLLPSKADVNRRWPERVSTNFSPTVAFAYELVFPAEYASLGLQLRPHMLTFPMDAGNRTVGCCVVIDSSSCPSSIVQGE